MMLCPGSRRGGSPGSRMLLSICPARAAADYRQGGQYQEQGRGQGLQGQGLGQGLQGQGQGLQGQGL